jgi:hypothetical protein
MIMAMWRGTALTLEDITTPYHRNLSPRGKGRRLPNDEIRMPKLEGMTNDLTANFFSGIRTSRLFRHSAFVLRHSVAEIGAVINQFTE